MSATQTTALSMPDGYTFTPVGSPIHGTALERFEKLLEKVEKRDPDRHDMYIYNDFFGYAVLELVDENLSSIHTLVTKKKWVESWHALIGLTLFVNTFSDWTQVDDGDRVIATDKVYCAMLITTIRGLDSSTPSLLTEANFPDLESTLATMAGWGDCTVDLSGTKYAKVLKGYGKRLFGNRTDEERELRKEQTKVAFDAYLATLTEEKRKELLAKAAPENEDEDEDDEDEDEDEEAEEVGQKARWFGKAKADDADWKNADFKVAAAWKDYKSQLAGSPRVPLKGAPVWDLTKWSAAERQKFSLGRFDDEFSD